MTRRRYRSEAIRVITVRGIEIEIFVNQDGEFSARAAGEWFREETMKAILPKIKKAVERSIVVIGVPVTLLGVRRERFTERVDTNATITGYIEKKKLYRVRYPDGSNDTIAEDLSKRYGSHDAFIAHPLKIEQVVGYRSLLKAKDDAAEAFEAWKEKHIFDDLEDAVRQAQKDAVDTPDESDVVDDEADPRRMVGRRR